MTDKFSTGPGGYHPAAFADTHQEYSILIDPWKITNFDQGLFEFFHSFMKGLMVMSFTTTLARAGIAVGFKQSIT